LEGLPGRPLPMGAKADSRFQPVKAAGWKRTIQGWRLEDVRRRSEFLRPSPPRLRRLRLGTGAREQCWGSGFARRAATGARGRARRPSSLPARPQPPFWGPLRQCRRMMQRKGRPRPIDPGRPCANRPTPAFRLAQFLSPQSGEYLLREHAACFVPFRFAKPERERPTVAHVFDEVETQAHATVASR
jgi:hypothetical protein